MKTGKYTIKELFNNRYIEQIVIPEIQRDYVWGAEQVNGLLNSINTDFNYFTKWKLPLPENFDPAVADEFTAFYKGKACSSNIGFIYAYNDSAYPGRYFLIDGQQRITTIYLVLLALAVRNDLTGLFEKQYLHQGALKLDYRVREASHEFLSKFIFYTLSGGRDVKDQSWYYADYGNDKTISGIVNNYALTCAYFEKQSLDEKGFLDYLQEHVEFWYFDTNISEQGEELYIYMNARGEQMQGNENLKADLLGKLSDTSMKNSWGEKWEKWQDIFWQNRGTNPNADRGFNEFLKCLAGLENYLNNKTVFYSPEEFEGKEKGGVKDISYTDLCSALNIEKIEKYVSNFFLLIQRAPDFRMKYEYAGWLKPCLKTLWNLFNGDKTNWFTDYNNANRGAERNKMVLAWSVLHYLASLDAREFDTDEAFRVLRFFYIRFNNFNRSVSKIDAVVKSIITNGLWSQKKGERELLVTPDSDLMIDGGIDEEEDNSEETQRAVFFRKLPDPDIRQYESVIWQIEDHPYNLNGRDLKNVNFSHLVSLKENPSLDTLHRIKNEFYTLFPLKDDLSNGKIIASILLFYGRYWYQDSPWYYQNYCFDDWRRIVRDMDGDKKAFKQFFNQRLLEPEKPLDTLFDELSGPVDADPESTDLYEQFKWYASKLKRKMWHEGGFIAIRHDQGTDRFFRNSKALFNTKGNYKGGNPAKLSRLVKKVETAGPLTEPDLEESI
jgi:hypothetical protein